MSGFYIKSITAHGSGKKDATVSFCEGLNIIQGYSDTGKTCILKCIDYMFGSSEKPFDRNTGYCRVTMQLVTPKGKLTLRRVVGRRQIHVESEIPNIKGGIYDIGYRKNQKNLVINSIWLKLLGIDDDPMIIKNSDFDKQHLTWRTLLNLIYIKENSIGKAESIVVPEQYMEKTLFLSALLYLISGRNFSETDAQTKKEIRVARRKAVEEYVNKQLRGISDRKKVLAEQLNILADTDVEVEIARMIADIEAIDAAITRAVSDSQELLGEIMIAEERAAECSVLLSRYNALKSQYTGDIRRLTFIVEGEVEYQSVPQSAKCPFCDGKLPVHDRKSYIEASRAELNRIVAQLNGLSETEADVKKEQLDIAAELTELHSKRTNIEMLISEQLCPKTNALQDTLKNYQEYIRLRQEMDLIESFSDGWTTDLRELAQEGNDTPKYHPREYFDDAFLKTMDRYAKSILEECNYENLTSARFDLKDFDIEVNGGKKATNHGKGYRAFLNTVVALMFRRYLARDAKYNPGLLIIDTPLLGLDQGVDDAAPESMRTSLFKYFMNNQADGQMIVVENLDHIPDLDYEDSGATVITFTKGRSTGRYGFLNDLQLKQRV